MRAILVSVDYGDILKHTLPYNRHHFEDVMVVTDSRDTHTKELANEYECQLFITDAFYDDGADFNKWKALEYALDCYGRRGWLVLMDADVAWPKDIGITTEVLLRDRLYTPIAHTIKFSQLPLEVIPPENKWTDYRERGNQVEWAGYTQIFHATDYHLPPPPWHDTGWRHAGGADSFFQRRWPAGHKLRPPFEVLHIGESGKNWCGRSTPYLDGTTHPDSDKRQATLGNYMHLRRLETRKTRKFTYRTFKHERLTDTNDVNDQ
jgi:hypothetical protein